MSIFKSIILPLFFIGIDQAVKLWTILTLKPINYHGGYPYGGIGVFKDFWGVEFSLVHATNLGAAWSLFSEHSKLLLIVRILLISVLAWYLFSKKRPDAFAWLLIFSGAVSNVLDFFLYGHVIDMFHFILWGYDYPVFNAADSLIFLGALLLIFKQGNPRVAAAKN